MSKQISPNHSASQTLQARVTSSLDEGVDMTEVDTFDDHGPCIDLWPQEHNLLGATSKPRSSEHSGTNHFPSPEFASSYSRLAKGLMISDSYPNGDGPKGGAAELRLPHAPATPDRRSDKGMAHSPTARDAAGVIPSVDFEVLPLDLGASLDGKHLTSMPSLSPKKRQKLFADPVHCFRQDAELLGSEQCGAGGPSRRAEPWKTPALHDGDADLAMLRDLLDRGDSLPQGSLGPDHKHVHASMGDVSGWATLPSRLQPLTKKLTSAASDLELPQSPTHDRATSHLHQEETTNRLCLQATATQSTSEGVLHTSPEAPSKGYQRRKRVAGLSEEQRRARRRECNRDSARRVRARRHEEAKVHATNLAQLTSMVEMHTKVIEQMFEQNGVLKAQVEQLQDRYKRTHQQFEKLTDRLEEYMKRKGH